MIELSDWLIFAAVVAARLFLPLLIPLYPLPGILIALIIDGIDQTIFQVFATTLPLDGYQSYDKALDIYYLTIAYISTFRNWTNLFAFNISRFLFYYRLIGVALFETLQWRPLLILFPNTFEYFFIWYEALRLWWDPKKLPRTFVLSAAVAIWLIIKLPQEYWIHIAQLDVTDMIKVNLLGGTLDTPWAPLIAANWLGILITLLVLAAALVLLIRWLRHVLPTPHHHPIVAADKNNDPISKGQLARARYAWRAKIFDRDLLEKIIIMFLLTTIFTHVLPNATASTFNILLQVGLFMTLNTIVSHFLARHGTSFLSGVGHFLAVLALNTAVVVLLAFLPGGSTNWLNALFFIYLLSLLVTLFDRYQPIHAARFPNSALIAD